MSETDKSVNRIRFFEQLHQEFLFLKGYGTYTYISPKDVNQLYDAYCSHHHNIPCTTPQNSEITFMRSYIRSL